MKKLVGILMLTMALTMLAACSSNDVSSNDGALKNGTYEAKGDEWEFGSEEATVIINNNKIEEISLRRIDTEGKEVNYDEYIAAGAPDLVDAMAKLSADMIDKQTFEVDSVSGATLSSDHWKVAVQRALEQAK